MPSLASDAPAVISPLEISPGLFLLLLPWSSAEQEEKEEEEEEEEKKEEGCQAVLALLGVVQHPCLLPELLTMTFSSQA